MIEIARLLVAGGQLHQHRQIRRVAQALAFELPPRERALAAVLEQLGAVHIQIHGGQAIGQGLAAIEQSIQHAHRGAWVSFRLVRGH
jgi:hypothetical protein